MTIGIGFVIGCFTSILLWKIDRTYLFFIVNKLLKKLFKKDLILEIFYFIVIIVSIIALYNIKGNEMYNFITAFLVIDVSNNEKKNLKLQDKIHFYDSISTISRSLLCGFIAPLFFIMTFGNSFAIAYLIINKLHSIDRYVMIKILFNLFSFVPSIITQFLLYLVYLIRNKRMHIDFKGEYLVNCVKRPLLNLDIMGAYIESVNFYYHFDDKDIHYIKSYGEYTNKIDEICVKDYLSISYGICILSFILFYFTIKSM